MKKIHLILILASAVFSTVSHAASYGNGTAAYSTVRSATKPTIPSGTYYPSSSNTSAIQTAIDTANAAGGGTVQLSSGTYNITSPITLKSNVRLKGNGKTSTILKRSSSFTNSTGYFVGAHDASLEDVEIRDLTLDGDYTASELINDLPELIGFGVESGIGSYNERIRFWKVDIQGFTMGIHIKGTTHVRIEYSDIHDNGGTYLYHNIYFRRVGQSLVYKCNIYDSVVGSGLKLAGGTTNVSNESRYFTVKDNNIYNNERINLNIQGCHHLLIENNYLAQQYSSVSKMAGLYLVSYGGYQCRYTDIINNEIVDNLNNGIYIDDCKTVSIQGNACLDNGTDYNIVNSTDLSCDYNSSY